MSCYLGILLFSHALPKVKRSGMLFAFAARSPQAHPHLVQPPAEWSSHFCGRPATSPGRPPEGQPVVFCRFLRQPRDAWGQNYPCFQEGLYTEFVWVRMAEPDWGVLEDYVLLGPLGFTGLRVTFLESVGKRCCWYRPCKQPCGHRLKSKHGCRKEGPG